MMSEKYKKVLLKYIDKRLIDWAEWFNRKTSLGTGFSPVAIEYRLMTEGHITREYLGSKPLPVHDEAEQIELLILEMAKKHPRYARIIRHHYLRPAEVNKQAKRFRCSELAYYRLLHSARWWLINRLILKQDLTHLRSLYVKMKK